MRKIQIRLENSFLFIFIAMIIAQGFYTSCANQGMPTGGPKDSIPPVLIETIPLMQGLNFSGNEVRLTFNEFIIADAVSEELVVSPPLQKRPSVRTKSKSLIVAFNEELKPDVTYSLDFKNAVVDNNERNPYKNLRMTFSTGERIDTLRVAGVVKNSFTLDPADKTVVMLHSNLHDSAVIKTIPDYIARTDPKGLFFFDNIKAGSYRLYALNDANSNLIYDPGAEEIAFADSVIVPSAVFQAEPDTLVSGADSLLIAGNTLFYPQPQYLRIFTEKIFDQYIIRSGRDNRHRMQIIFNEPVSDTLGLRLLDRPETDWYILEHNPEMDSLVLWIADTLVASIDTLRLELSFTQLDSLKQSYMARDTLSLVYSDKTRPEPRRRGRDDEEKHDIVQFTLFDNVRSSGFDLNIPVWITVPEPVKSFDISAVRLIEAEDLTDKPLPAKITADSTKWRTWRIDYKWEPNTAYILEIDSAAVENIYGITSLKFKKQFTTQKDDFYGSIILHLTSVNCPLIVQLLDNSKDEKILRTLNAEGNGTYTFDFLPPSKYKVKVIYDENNNGIWDTGSFEKGVQPERIAYLPEIVKVRSNWDSEFRWDLLPDPTFKKELIDKEELELQLKKQQEEQKKLQEQEREPVQMDMGGRSLGIPGRR